MIPVREWSARAFWSAFVLLLLLAAGAVVAIRLNDRPLAATCTGSSAALEWVSHPSEAANIVGDWESAGGAVSTVTRGVLIDYAFIVFYSTLLALTVFRCAHALPEVDGWYAAGESLGWLMWIAGALDLFENGCILLELHQHVYALAPVTALVAWLKWTSAGIGVLYVAFTAILWFRTRAAGVDPDLHHELRSLKVASRREEARPAGAPAPSDGSTPATA